MRSRFAVLTLLLALWLSGCGSSSTATNVSTGTGADTSTTSSAEALPASVQVSGFAQSHAPLPNAQVTVYSADGRTLLSEPVSTAESGRFRFTLPRNEPLHIVVTPTGGKSVAPLAAEVSGESLDFIGVNFVTNLVAVYRAQHPGVTLKDAEARVRTFLAIPAEYDLQTGLDADSGPFSRTVFAARAAANGGVEAYTIKLAAQVDVGPPQPCVSTAAAGTSTTITTDVFAGIAKDCFQNMAKSGAQSLAKDTFSWATGLGGGFGIGAPSMKDIGQELDLIQSEILQLQTSLINDTNATQYNTDQAALAGNSVIIQNRTSSVKGIADTYSTMPGPGVNPVSAAPQATLITQLLTQNPTFTDMAAEILDYLLGVYPAPNQQSMVALYAAIVMATVEADSPSQYLGYPLRNNNLQQMQRNQLDYYLQTVNEAINLIGEVSHLVTRDVNGNFTTDADNITTARAAILQLLAGMRQASQLVPLKLASDYVLVDTEYGRTWDLRVSEPYPYYEFGSPTGPYWLIGPPSKEDMDKLRARCLPLNSKYPSKALPQLGFIGAPTGDEFKVWINKDQEQPTWLFPKKGEAYYYDFNSGKIDKVNGRKHSYYEFAMLAYPGNAEQNATNPLLANGGPGDLTVTATSPYQLKCVATNNPIQSGGSFKVGGKSVSVPVTTIYRASDDITSYVSWTSSDPSMAEVSNFSGQQGQVLWHPNARFTNTPRPLTPVTFTATIHGKSASVTVDPPSPAPVATLTSMEIVPNNVLYKMPLPAVPIQDYFHATGFYDDQTAVNIDNQVTWSVVSTADGSPIPPSQAGFTALNFPNLLVITSTLQTSQLTLKATLNGVTGTAQISVPLYVPKR